MKKIIALSILYLTVAINSQAQDASSQEKFGNTLNLGVGVGYYGYIGHTMPFGTINYEFDVVKNFTLAPFIGMYTYQKYYYWGNPNHPHWDPSYRQYSYRVTVIPVGIKGTYYFDQLFRAGSRWDFYAAGSVGFAIRNVTWESGYYGDKQVYHSPNPLYLDAHIGAEFHASEKVGLFLDLSTGVSTFGLAVHF